MSPFARRLRRRKLKSEINVVPYIDVMLVLLIIFMVTAPMLSLGVDVDTPKADAKAMESKKEPIVVSVLADGGYTLRLTKEEKARAVDAAQLASEVGAVVRNNPEVAVFVAGDGKASYATVYDAMVLLQHAGVEKIGLVGQPGQAH
jgi:biopolymer transport protein TolR